MKWNKHFKHFSKHEKKKCRLEHRGSMSHNTEVLIQVLSSCSREEGLLVELLKMTGLGGWHWFWQALPNKHEEQTKGWLFQLIKWINLFTRSKKKRVKGYQMLFALQFFSTWFQWTINSRKIAVRKERDYFL